VQALFAPVCQGYGATETAACVSIQECFSTNGRPADTGGGRVGAIHVYTHAHTHIHTADTGGGRVGAIQPATELKLVSVPDMGYLVSDEPPSGEILVAGKNVTQHGYYKLTQDTAEAFVRHSDGKIWFHTGDIGVMDPDGVLRFSLLT